MTREARVSFTRLMQPLISRGSNDQKAEYRQGGGDWGLGRDGRAADGSSGGERRRTSGSSRQSGTAAAPHRAAGPSRASTAGRSRGVRRGGGARAGHSRVQVAA